MKKILMIVAAMFIAFSINAQPWEIVTHKADELKGNKEYTSYFYDNEVGSFVFWSNSNTDFRIFTNEHKTFDAVTVYNNVYTIFGLYDVEGNLIKKYDFYTLRHDGDGCRLDAPVNKKQSRAEILKFLKEGKGTLRILVSYYSGGTFDFTVPTIN